MNPQKRHSTMPRPRRLSSAAALLAVGAILSAVSAGNSDPPPLETAVDAWIRARAWVDDLKVPSVPAAPPAPVMPPVPPPAAVPGAAPNAPGAATPVAEGPGAVAVVLRMRGRLVGTGLAFGAGTDLLERAVSQALDAVATDDAVLALPREERDHIGRELSLELELASQPVPVVGRAVAQVVSRIEPALEGLALRRGERWTWTMPSIVQASNIASDPIRTCAAMLQQLAIDPRELPSQALPEGTSFYTAPTRRLAQLEPRGAPFEVIRGRQVIPLTAIGPAGRAEFAAALARHLRAHVTRPAPAAPTETNALKALGIRGDYRPHLDHHRDLAAPSQDQALAALALATASRSSLLPEADRRAAAAAAADLLLALSVVAEIEDPPLSNPSAVALALLADDALERSGIAAPARPAEFLDQLRTSLRTSLGAPNAAVDHARAIEIAAASVLDARGRPVIDRVVLDALLEKAWAAPPSTALVGMLPWLLVAERERGAFADSERAARILARAEPVRRAMLASQLGVGGPEEPAPDAAGGFALTGGSRPMATSQSARPTLALALMLAEPSLSTTAELPDLMRSQLMALRFLRQLAVDERSAYAFRNSARTLGGVCDSLWDSTQPVAASSMTLMAVVESEAALKAAAARSKASTGKSGNLDAGSSGVKP